MVEKSERMFWFMADESMDNALDRKEWGLFANPTGHMWMKKAHVVEEVNVKLMEIDFEVNVSLLQNADANRDGYITEDEYLKHWFEVDDLEEVIRVLIKALLRSLNCS